MNRRSLAIATTAIALTLAGSTQGRAQNTGSVGNGPIKHVLLLSVDGMHAVDLYNCTHGVPRINGGEPYCPNMAALEQTAADYTAASTSKPSDSFPGLMSIVTGATPKTMGVWYDVGFDRSLDPPQVTTGNGVAGGNCIAYGVPRGSRAEYEEGIDIDQTKLNGGAPGASLTDGGLASIDTRKLPRDPAQGCAPVEPWNFVRVNTVYGVIHQAGGYTAWSDKHPAYGSVSGPGAGNNIDDFYAPEINSTVIGLPGITTAEGVSCAQVRDSSQLGAWSDSFENIQCYDQLKVNAILNQIAGKTHSGASAQVPALFGMNFQSVSVGQKLIENGDLIGGYKNGQGTPSRELFREIKYVDAAIGNMVDGLKDVGQYEDTLLIVTAKHGQSPIDPSLYKANGGVTPATLLAADLPDSESPTNPTGIGPTEDDISLLWLKRGANVNADVKTLEAKAAAIGLGQIFYGASLALDYNVPGLGLGEDPRTPDIIVTPNVGTTYSNSKKKQAEHGGFAHDDTNVLLLLENPQLTAKVISAPVSTAQIAPTILVALGLDRNKLQAVQLEGTAILPGLPVR